MREIDDSRGPSRLSPDLAVREAARAAGFPLVGTAGIDPHPRSTDIFKRWIGAGMHGELGYLAAEAEKRRDPSLLLKDARSVVCVGVDYYSRSKEDYNDAASDEERGRFALYAHGRDYHEVLGAMLADLEGRLRAISPGVKTRAMVDATPISERDAALRAGIGWLGKNTCVISPVFGSWIVLGEILTDLELDHSAPLESRCGGCTRCVDACPTGALGEFSLDAGKCISYLTIEKRGEIPPELQGAVGDRVFGCDECQAVCPFNAGAGESVVFGGSERNDLLPLRLDELAALSNSRFRRLARHTAVERCGPAGMRRNAKIAAKNRLSPP